MSSNELRIGLTNAIEREDVETVRRIVGGDLAILRQGVGVNDETPLHLASVVSPEVGKAMLDLGAEVDISNPGYSPLFVAVREGPIETVQMLLDHGANVNFISRGKTTPLFYAATSRRPDREQVVELLVNCGATWDLHSVIYMQQDEIARRILSEDSAALAKSPLSSTVLATAVLTGRPLDIVDNLLRQGGNPNGDPNHVPPLVNLLGRADPNLEMIRLLLSRGANPNARSPSGNTLLRHYKKNFNNRAVIDLLVSYGGHE